MAHEHLHHLAQAAGDNDSLAEEGGIHMALTRLDLDVEDVGYVAEQRALRAVMAESGRIPELQRAHRSGSARPQSFALSAMEKRKLVLYAAMYMDGIAIGWRAHQLSSPADSNP